jgi:type I restriction enzyme S subunit
MQLCQSYIQELKHKYPAQEIGPYIEESNERNKNGYFGADALMGVCSEGTFIKSIANTSGLVFNNYKIVHRGDFAYSNRINVGSIALRYDDDCIISPSYAVFRIKNECRDKLLNEYLAIWFRRSEFLRATLFFAFGTIKDDFSHREMCRVKMPIPPLDVQRAIVNIYKCANEAKQIAAEADRLSREVCPALLQHVINS